MHNVTVNFSRTASRSFNHYAFVDDVAGDAGIAGVSTDPFDWGVPQLSFSSLSSLRDVTPSRRTDQRLTLGYGWTRPVATKHTLRVGGDVRLDESDSQTDANARGAFVFTGLYSSGGVAGGRAAAASTSPTSCSACRSRRRSSTAPATCACRGKSLSAVSAGRLAQERER